jgi:circadian clock protein KaiC
MKRHVKKSKKVVKRAIKTSPKKIKKVKVVSKSKNLEKISSGIINMDELIDGGYEKNSINIVAGEAGSGKSIFAMQFLIEGLKRNENCLYISFEEQKVQFYKNMLDFGWDLGKYEDEGKFTFLEYTPEKVKTMLEEGGGSIETVVLTKEVKRIAIDTLSSFVLLYEDELERREGVLSLFKMFRNWGCTCVATLDQETEKNESVEFESDSLIKLYSLRIGEIRKRFLEIVKMRGSKHSDKLFSLKIDSKGVSIEKKPLSSSQASKLGF